MSNDADFPALTAVVLDAEDTLELARFYMALLGFGFLDGQPDEGTRWLVLADDTGAPRLAIQEVDHLPRPTWPSPEVAQQMHLDLTVVGRAALRRQHERAVALGATVLDDRSESPDDPLVVYADPAGHPFCIIATGGA